MLRLRRTFAILGIIGLSTALSSCVTSEKYAAAQEALKGSPALRQELVDRCLKNARVVGEERRMLAKVANVSANAPLEKILCTRVTNALASGRLSYSDFQSMEFGHVTPGLIRALQDR